MSFDKSWVLFSGQNQKVYKYTMNESQPTKLPINFPAIVNFICIKNDDSQFAVLLKSKSIVRIYDA